MLGTLFFTSACESDRAPLSKNEQQALSGTIYFISERAEDAATWRIRPDASGEALVMSGQPSAYPYANSPDRKRVAFVVTRSEMDEIVVADPDGKNPITLAPAEGGVSWYPNYSPNGEDILFESSREAFREIYKVPANGGAPVRLTNNREGNFDASWSPDGKKIAFASSRHGQLDLFVMNADGSEQKRLTQHAGDAIKPQWAPDGSAIVFISGRDGVDQLFAITGGGENIRNLTSSKEGVESFSWSKNNSIVFAVRAPDGKSKLRVLDFASGKIIELSGKDDNDSNAAWSPDGRHLVFASSIEGHSDLWIMRADGSRRTRLTRDPRGAWLPRWLDI